MARFLSPEWLAEVEAAARRSPAFPADTHRGRVTVQQVVTGGPAGEVAYAATVGDGTVVIRVGRAERPDVTFSEDWATAAAIARGALSAQEAFMAGRLRVAGDMAALLRHGPALGRLADAFAEVQGRTAF
jgi:SCP-2 sterol transfer family